MATAALLGAGGLLPASAASASARPSRESSAALRAALRGDLSHYLTTRHKAEHVSAVSLRVTYRGDTPSINLAAGTTRYNGGPPVSTSALWQVGSNTKAFTAVILLQLEAEGKLSINDPLGKFLPQYPAWGNVTIKRLLNMTSRIPDYALTPAFAAAISKDPGARFTAARLVSYAVGLTPAPKGYYYSDTNYILAQMIIEKVSHDTYADQLTKRIITPLRLHNLCYAPCTCPRTDAARMPAGYFFEAGAPPLLGKPMPRLAITWTQAAGGILSSLPDLTTWERALYQGQELPPAQQRQLESLISETTGKPIGHTTAADPDGYALGLTQLTYKPLGTVWWYRGGTALVAGIFYLITFISIPTLALYGPVKNHRDWILTSGSNTGVLVGGFLEVIVALAGIGTAVTLYPVVKRQNEGLALGFVAARVVEGSMIFVGVLSLLSLVTLRQDLGGPGGANAASLVTTGASHVATYKWTFLLGQNLMPGINALLLGTLMYQSRLVPRVIPVIGLIGAPLIIGAVFATLFGGLKLGSSLPEALPVAAWELSLGVWLVVKGFSPSPVTAGMVAPRTPPAPVDVGV